VGFPLAAHVRVRHQAGSVAGVSAAGAVAWERPERLRFVDPHTTGVAFLTRTISWRGGQVESRPRLQPLELPSGVALMAVVRLEGSGALPDAQALAEPILRDAARQAFKRCKSISMRGNRSAPGIVACLSGCAPVWQPACH